MNLTISATTLDTWQANSKTFSIRRATPRDADSIIEVAKSAFFDPAKPERWYYRSEASREYYAKNDYPRRIVQSDTYSVYVCTDDESDTIVGTAFLQFNKTDEMPKAEFGCFAIQPSYQKGYEIGQRIFGQILKEAQERQVPALYLYIVGPCGEYNQEGLQKLYQENFGFEVVGHKISKSQKYERFISAENPEGNIPLIVMERKFTYFKKQ